MKYLGVMGLGLSLLACGAQEQSSQLNYSVDGTSAPRQVMVIKVYSSIEANQSIPEIQDLKTILKLAEININNAKGSDAPQVEFEFVSEYPRQEHYLKLLTGTRLFPRQYGRWEVFSDLFTASEMKLTADNLSSKCKKLLSKELRPSSQSITPDYKNIIASPIRLSRLLDDNNCQGTYKVTSPPNRPNRIYGISSSWYEFPNEAIETRIRAGIEKVIGDHFAGERINSSTVDWRRLRNKTGMPQVNVTPDTPDTPDTPEQNIPPFAIPPWWGNIGQ